MQEAFQIAALWLGVAVLSTIIASHLRISMALVEICVGMAAAFVANQFVGPDALKANQDWLRFIASIGAVLLTFLAGAELDPAVIRTKWKEVALVGAVGFFAPFFEHDNDLPPERTEAILQCFSRIRTALLEAARTLELPVEVRRTSLSWELQCLLTHFQISLVEIGPKQMRGYGEVEKPASDVLQQVQQELGKLVGELAVQIASLSRKKGPGSLESE